MPRHYIKCTVDAVLLTAEEVVQIRRATFTSSVVSVDGVIGREAKQLINGKVHE